LTNLLLRQIVRSGWVSPVRVQPNRVRYVITPAGASERARRYRARLASDLRFYREARDRIHESFTLMARAWNGSTTDGKGSQPRIVLHGVGELAEIGIVCLQDCNLRLVGVIGDGSKRTFFGHAVHGLEHLDGLTLDGIAVDRLVIMSLGDVEQICDAVERRGVPKDAIAFI
jgi:hypothetical protein